MKLMKSTGGNVNRKHFLQGLGVLILIFSLGGCATTPYQGDGKTRSDTLLQQQFQAADKALTAQSGGRIIFAGFSLHSQSRAFRNDVVTAEKAVRSIDPSAIVFKLDNPTLGQAHDWPYATAENLAAVLAKVGALARPQDKVVVLVSTHGNVNALGINFSNQNYPHINARMLNESLAGLRGKPVLLLLSACHSGSFVQALSGPTRVILTAAASDRSSFGCQFHSTNTYFIDALLNQHDLLDRSLTQLMDAAKADIQKREQAQKLSPPSSPQIFVGAAAKEWANQALKNWLTPGQRQTP
ncbi:MAG: C13 family peptidase [Pseudomonadota bacterium]|nr:C13 family peptidase [Pseudomonadota bacterium]